MPEMSNKFVPKHKGDKNPNPKLLKFVRHVTDRVPGKIKMDTDAPEYWGWKNSRATTITPMPTTIARNYAVTC